MLKSSRYLLFVNRYLESVQPLLGDEEFEATKKVFANDIICKTRMIYEFACMYMYIYSV